MSIYLTAGRSAGSSARLLPVLLWLLKPILLPQLTLTPFIVTGLATMGETMPFRFALLNKVVGLIGILIPMLTTPECTVRKQAAPAPSRAMRKQAAPAPSRAMRRTLLA